jgi:hypothetical protein
MGPVFAFLLAVHIAAGLTCVVSGAVALLSPKQRGRHPSFGAVYSWSLVVVFLTMAGMAALHWPQDAHLAVLGVLAFGTGTIGYAARKRHWPGWLTIHMVGMSLSYILLLTAFYVDNGPHLPLWNRLPRIAFWLGPSLIGLLLLARALHKRGRALADGRAAARAVADAMVGWIGMA